MGGLFECVGFRLVRGFGLGLVFVMPHWVWFGLRMVADLLVMLGLI